MGNRVDCAMALLDDPSSFSPNLRGLGRQNPSTVAAFEHQTVKKSGAIDPFVTIGMVTDVSADLSVAYPQGSFGFVQQIVVRGIGGAFGMAGDSGSLVVDATSLAAVGLLFAASDDLGLVNPIDVVLSDLKVSLV
jgi:hypothetical protein